MKNLRLIFVLLSSMGVSTSIAQSFSCNAISNTLVVQFNGCGSTISWTDDNSASPTKIVNTPDTYTVLCGTTPFSFKVTDLSTCPSFACDLSVSATVNTVTAGQSSTLSYQNCTNGTVSWDNGLGNGNNKLVSPSTTTTYTATCTPDNGLICSRTITVNYVECSLTASATPSSIVPGGSSTLSYTGCAGGSVDWVTDNDDGVGSGNNVVVSPTVTTNYIASCSKGGGYCLSYVTVTVAACSITASANPQNINVGQSSTLSYTGCSNGTVVWDNGAGSGNNKIVSPVSTTTYTATCTPNGGGSTCTSNVTVNVSSCAVTASANPQNINSGQSSTLSYTGCTNGTVSWDNSAGTGNNVIVSPSVTTTYTATCTPNGGGSTCTSNVAVNVSSCAVTASANPQNINSGQSSTLSYTGCANGTVSWDNGAGTGNNVIVSPTITTTYTATCTPNGGGSTCTSNVAVNVSSCAVTASANPQNINSGQSSTLSYTGCTNGTVSWDNSAGTGNNVIVSPTITTTYTATCTPNGGGSTCTSNVTVNVSSCAVNASANPQNINSGQSSTLSYTGCTNGTVSWDNGAGTGNNVIVSPTITTTYTATCTPNGGGSTCTSNVTVNVSSCAVNASANPQSINSGQSSTLSYTGCSNGTVSWDNGAGTGNNVIVSPTITTTYTATCTPNGGGSTCTSNVTVNVGSCAVTAFANPQNINSGQSSTLSYTGCTNGTVSWDNGGGTGNNVIVNPSITTTYTATCTLNGGGSTCTSNVTINVGSCAVNASANPQSINSGQSTTLSYTGCTNGTVSWDNGAGTGNNVIVSPTITTTYTATCTPNGGGSTCTSNVTINVGSCAVTASANPQTINSGQSSTLSYTGCANGTVSWDNGAGTGNNVIVSPTITTTYTATCTPNGGGSTCTSNVTVNVGSCAVTASANPQNINSGQSSTLSYTGCANGTVSWNNGAGTGNNVIVSPTITTTYTATCTPNGGGSTCTSNVTINVSSCSINAFANPESMNAGQSSTLSYTGCVNGSVSWNNGAGSGNNKIVSPASTTTYTATCTPNGGGSTCTSSVTVNVASCVVSAFATSNNIFVGESTTIIYSGCVNGLVNWDNGLGSGNYINVSPSANITYTATCTPNGGGNSCSASLTINVTSAPLSMVSVTQKSTTCFDTQNGSFTVKLNRSIVKGESYFLLSIFKDNSFIKNYEFKEDSFTTPENLAPGNYAFVVESFVNNKVSSRIEGNISISRPELVGFSVNKTNINCFGGSDGTISLNASGGTGNYWYILNNNSRAPFNSGVNHTIYAVSPGQYTIRVIDKFECSTAEQTITVSQPQQALSLTKISQKDPRGFETRDGIAVVSANGGTPQYTFDWTDGQGNSYGSGLNNNSENRNNTLRGGVYTVRVYDVNYAKASQKEGCFSQTSFTLVEPPIIEAKFETTKVITCFGRKDGTLRITPSGGVPDGIAYKLLLRNKSDTSVAFSPNGTEFANLGKGEYILKVTDANEVSRSFEYSLTEPQKVTTLIGGNHLLLCAGDRNGRISVVPSGGTAPYSVNWSNNAKTLNLTNLNAGIYSGVVTDVRGCPSDIIFVNIKAPAQIVADLSIKAPKCANSCDGSAQAIISGGTTPYTFSWSGRKEQSPGIDKLCGDENLNFTVTDANKCIVSKQSKVPRPLKLESKIETEKSLCPGEAILLDATLAGVNTYRWLLPDGQTSNQARLEAKLAGVYTLTLVDKALCEFSSTINVKTAPAQGIIRFAVSSIAPSNEPIVVLNLSNPAPVQVEWTAPQQAVVEQRTNELLQFRIAPLGIYKVGIKAKFVQCEMYEEKTIEIVDFVPKTVAIQTDNTTMKIGPNPNEGEFEVAVQFDTATSFRLIVWELSQTNQVLVDITEPDKVPHFSRKITGLPQGIYILSLETPTKRITKKISVLK